jgi:hypothetical protein
MIVFEDAGPALANTGNAAAAVTGILGALMDGANPLVFFHAVVKSSYFLSF